LLISFAAEVGLERLKLPLLLHFVDEIEHHRLLPRCREGLVRFWLHTLREEKVRNVLFPVLVASSRRKRFLPVSTPFTP
jgi:hypothetical protein